MTPPAAGGAPGSRRALVVGTAGHIDHGKSALVRALTGTDPDRLKEEQARGITIDLGFAHATLDGVATAFVDVPGHERFVRNMLAGAGGIDAVVLVVAADESVMPQTREHFQICRLLGIRRGVVAITKCDLADRDTIEIAMLEAAELVAGSPLEGAALVPVSPVTGEGLERLGREIAALAGRQARSQRSGVVRLPVDRAFTVKGFGTVVTGTLVSGVVAAGDTLELLPAGGTARVRGVQVHGAAADRVAAPSRVALNLGAVGAGTVRRGVTLATPGTLAVTSRVDLRLELLRGTRPLKHGARVRVHHGTSERLARVSIAATRATPDADWDAVPPGRADVAVPPGGEALVRLRLEQPAVLTRDDLVVCRACSPPATIGGGRVLDPEPPRGGVRRSGSADRFRILDSEGLPFDTWLKEAGGRGLDADTLVRRGGLTPDAARAALDRALTAGVAIGGGDRVFGRTLADDIRARIVRVLESFHVNQPLEPGMPREALREASAPGAAPALFEAAIAGLDAGGVVGGADRVSLASHRPALSDEEDAWRTRIEQAARDAGLRALDADGLAAAAGAARADVEGVIRYLVRAGRLVRVDAMLVDADALGRLKDEVIAMAAGQTTPAEIDVAAFKGAYGLTRKHAIPLLEWLDRERVTRRLGSRRLIVARPD